MTTMADRVFLDTNVLLRTRFAELNLFQETTTLFEEVQKRNVEFWLSRQVIREFIVQVTRPQLLQSPLTADEIEQQLIVLRNTFQIADETAAVTDKLIELLKAFPSGGKQIHDANIVATMLVYGVNTLITLNTEDMRRFEPRITLLSPLTPSPAT
jgi:predicted nucleic acid-binding protein